MPLSPDPNPLPVLFTSPKWIDRSLLGWKTMLINQILDFYRFLRSWVLTHQPPSIYTHIIHTIPGTSQVHCTIATSPWRNPAAICSSSTMAKLASRLAPQRIKKDSTRSAWAVWRREGTVSNIPGKPTLFHHIRIQHDTKTEAFSKASIEHIERTSQCML